MTLPAFLRGLPDAARMRDTDRWAIEERGIPSLDLMERAGAGLAALTAEVAADGPVAVVCGKGNNGGDGYVAARLLREAGREVRVLATAPVDELRGDARANAERLPGPPPEPFAAGAALDGAAAAVDALLGTGFSGEPRAAAADAIEALNGWGGPVVACDVPSGVDASTGEAAGAAVRAVATATFAAAKPGLWITPGKELAGDVRVIDIGIPPGAPVAAPDVGLIHDASVLAEVPRRRPGWTKFTSGHVLVAGGARGLTGAPTMAAEGLNAHAGDLGALAARKAATILTPHEGELGRLLGVDSAAVKARRLHHARAAAREAQAIVVLKGDDTLVARPDGTVAVSPGATAALATAGTGDVLSGVLAAVLARGVEPFAAACAGVRLHARAGVRAAGERGVDGVVARDVIEALPHAW
jgi:NAD(P)H-hydrate epimerase